jgi:DNA-binding protein YbaB
MREIRIKKEQLMEQMDIVEESKEMIEDLLAEAIEAAKSI